MTDWRLIGARCNRVLRPASARVVSGGSISQALKVESDRGPVFVKLEAAADEARLAAETDGLKALAATRVLRIPEVLDQGVAAGQAWLVMEWVQAGKQGAPELLGERLAALHRHSAAEFGWSRDNFIGRTPQPNTRTSDWGSFVRDQRIGFQLSLARQAGYSLDSSRCTRLLEGIPAFYRDYQPTPSLLHGDLWGGNWFTDENGDPVIFDPAVYYGDHEADLAMTELFGGFGPAFYAAYQNSWPLDVGYPIRRDLHQLYHVLNHLNLFGGGYLGQAAALIERLCAELA